MNRLPYSQEVMLVKSDNATTVELDKFLDNLQMSQPVFEGIPYITYEDKPKLTWGQVSKYVTSFYAPRSTLANDSDFDTRLRHQIKKWNLDFDSNLPWAEFPSFQDRYKLKEVISSKTSIQEIQRLKQKIRSQRSFQREVVNIYPARIINIRRKSCQCNGCHRKVLHPGDFMPLNPQSSIFTKRLSTIQQKSINKQVSIDFLAPKSFNRQPSHLKRASMAPQFQKNNSNPQRRPTLNLNRLDTFQSHIIQNTSSDMKQQQSYESIASMLKQSHSLDSHSIDIRRLPQTTKAQAPHNIFSETNNQQDRINMDIMILGEMPPESGTKINMDQSPMLTNKSKKSETKRRVSNFSKQSCDQKLQLQLQNEYNEQHQLFRELIEQKMYVNYGLKQSKFTNTKLKRNQMMNSIQSQPSLSDTLASQLQLTTPDKKKSRNVGLNRNSTSSTQGITNLRINGAYMNQSVSTIHKQSLPSVRKPIQRTMFQTAQFQSPKFTERILPQNRKWLPSLLPVFDKDQNNECEPKKVLEKYK